MRREYLAKKFRWFTLFVLLGWLVSYSKYAYTNTTEVMILTDDAYPPYSFSKEGKAVGIYPDIIALADELMPEYQIVLEPVPWKRGLRLLETGRAFGLLPPYFYEQGRPYIAPYSVPILNEEVVVFCHNDVFSSESFTEWPRDFYDLKFGLNDGFSIGGREFWKAVDRGDIKVELASGNRNNLAKLQANRIDCYLNDKISVQWEYARMKREEKLDKAQFSVVLEVSREQGYVGFTNQNLSEYPYKNAFIESFNTAIRSLQQSGKVDKVVAGYIE